MGTMAHKAHKPVDALIDRRLARLVDDISMVPPAVQTEMMAQARTDSGQIATARLLLMDIAADAAPDQVMAALTAAGGPTTLADVSARLDAARDAQLAGPFGCPHGNRAGH